MFSKKALSNRLTKLIEANNNVDLEEVLLHEDFPQTVEKQSNILYQRILKREKNPWLYKIIDYALFNENPPKKYQEFNRIHQININASNFLENCGENFVLYSKDDLDDETIINYDTLQDYLIDTINRFITEPEVNTNPMYAGHFQRFIENFLKFDVLDHKTTIDNIISFLCNNCHMLAYQQLISKLIINKSLNNTEIYKLLTKILNRAVLAVTFIRNQINLDLNKPTSSMYSSRFMSRKKRYNVDSQPLNTNKSPIPLSEVFYFNEEEIIELNMKKIQFQKGLIDPKLIGIEYDSIEDAEMEAYLIIMTIRSCSYKNTDIISYFRDDQKNEYPLIQALFFCGIFCGLNSLISLEAFKLLGIIFNGSVTYSIEKWKTSEEEKSELSFYNDFADKMIFDSSAFTCKMVHALPLFWNHRYNLDDYEMLDDEKVIIDTSDYYNDGKKHERKREKGETALEILQPCLLSEPPISSQLIYSCTDIFYQLSEERLNILKRKFTNKEKRAGQMVYMDGIILDFYQHHFLFDKDTYASFSKLLSSKTIIPLLPTDMHYLKKEIQYRRPVLNGFLINFILRISDMKVSPFFWNKKSSFIMGHQKCFNNDAIIEVFNYREEYNIDILSENILYNKRMHSDDDEENKVIVVDEFPLNLPRSDETKEELSKTTKSLRNFKPNVKSVNEDTKPKQENKKNLSKNSEIENSKIRQFEEILNITSHSSNTKSEENYFIDSDEEAKYHVNAGLIGEGGTSITYKIIDKRTKVPMCKKVLKYKKGQTRMKDAQNALKEFEILQRITHPCICKSIAINISEKVDTKVEVNDDDYEEEDKNEVTTIALFLEYVDYNLSDFLNAKMINNTSKARIILDVVHAMNYLHKRNMMHRDLKIDNIMLNSLFETKIVDFGLASISESVIDGFSYVTNSLTKGIGTFSYMSPEMANMDEYTNKTDVYSFGVVLHFVFAKSLPKQELKDKMAGKAVKMPKPSSSISRFCIKLIEQCLSYDPSKRPSFDEILAQLRENSYELASGVDPSILSRRDKELDFIENYK